MRTGKDQEVGYSKVIGILLRYLSVVPARYSETPQFEDLSPTKMPSLIKASTDWVTSAKSV